MPYRYNIDRRLILLSVIIATASLSLLGVNIFSASVSDGYAALIRQQELSAHVHSSALLELVYFSRTGEERHYQHFHEELDKLLDDQVGLSSTLEINDIDSLKLFFSPLLGTHWDLKNMVRVYALYARKLPHHIVGFSIPGKHDFDQAILLRGLITQKLGQLHALAIQLHTYERAGDEEQSRRTLNRITRLDETISTQMDAASLHLNKGFGELQEFEVINLLLSSLFIIAIIFFLVFRMRRSLKQWREQLWERFKDVQRREQDYKQLINSIEDGIYIRDEEGKFIVINKKGAEMFGYSETELLGKTPLTIVPDDHPRDPASHYHDKAIHGATVTQNLWGKHKDGSVVPLEIKIAPGTYQGKHVSISVARDISDRERQLQELEEAYNENILLLGEVHHRVKNNMALISGLLQLQEFETEEVKVKVILAAAQNRILAIAQIHELLYHSKSFNKIDFDSFLESHINKLSQSLTNPYAFDYHLDVKPAVLNINQAIHCALLFNEALLLCIKHAVRQVDYPKIVIILRQVEERLNLTIKGDFPANAIPNKFPNEDRLSLDLIHNLKRQLEAKMHRSKGQYFSWHISFDIQETKGVGCSRVFEETSALGRATFE